MSRGEAIDGKNARAPDRVPSDHGYCLQDDSVRVKTAQLPIMSLGYLKCGRIEAISALVDLVSPATRRLR